MTIRGRYTGKGGLNSLKDVDLTSPISDNSILQYNSATGKWENVTQQDSGFLVDFEDDTTTGKLTAEGGFLTALDVNARFVFATATTTSGTPAKSLGWDGSLGFSAEDHVSGGDSEIVGVWANNALIQSWTRTDGGDSSSDIFAPLTVDSTLLLQSGGISDSTLAITFGATNLNGSGDWFTSGDFSAGGGTLLNALFNVDATLGTVGIGTAAQSTALLALVDTRTVDDSFDGLRGGVTLTPTVAGKTYISNNQIIAVTNNVDTAEICGFAGSVQITGEDQVSDIVIDRVCGVTAEVLFDKSSKFGAGSDLTATDMYLFYGKDLKDPGNDGFITNMYGLRLPDMTFGDHANIANSWAIQTNGGKHTFGGCLEMPITTVTTTTTLDETHYTVICNSATAIDIDLPAVSGITGRIYYIKNKNSGVVSVDPSGSETIDASTVSFTLDKDESITIQADANGWWII